MSAQPADELAPRARSAVDELEALILHRYPDATFRVTRGPDDTEAIHLVATVDVDDPDAVLDTVMDRMMDLQIEDDLPIYVIPVRPPERVLALRNALAHNCK